MSYANNFLRNFRPIFLEILREKQIEPERVELEIIDEESEGYGIFEPAGVRDVLEQISEDLNFLAIYTERPAYFYEFAETMYQENGLIVMIYPKDALRRTMGERGVVGSGAQIRCMRQREGAKLVLDFEWEGSCYLDQMRPGKYYIPIHKKPWQIGENLDIMIPIGYNTVIVKDIQDKEKKPGRDRFEEAFYNS